MLSPIRRRSALCAALLWALGAAVHAAPLEIKDNEGFGESLTALTFDLPDGWQGQGRVAWVKPCSGNELYEILVTATSADGQSGLRMAPSHQIVWNGVDVTGVDPVFAQLAVTQAEQAMTDMRVQFKDSNCHVGTLTGTDDILRRLILPKRPAGARILATAPNAAQLATYRQTMGTQIAGMKTDFDAVTVDLAYPGPQGELRERLWLSWYRYADDPATNRIAGLPHLRYQILTVEALTFVWAPASRAEADLAAAAAVLSGGRADPVWVSRVRAEQQRRFDDRRRTQAETEAARQDRLRQEDLARQRQHEQFLGTIRN